MMNDIGEIASRRHRSIAKISSAIGVPKRESHGIGHRRSRAMALAMQHRQTKIRGRHKKRRARRAAKRHKNSERAGQPAGSANDFWWLMSLVASGVCFRLSSTRGIHRSNLFLLIPIFR